ncbi:MAG: cytidine deaminase [Bacteroidales bacterium]|nr:cytidine deaminase [Bacteroidales bacterium]
MKTIKVDTIVYEYSNLSELSELEQKLVEEAKNATIKSYSPYSMFKVGSSILLENGEIICGNNQENAAYPSGLCAERVALFYANSKYPDQKVKIIAIAAKGKNGFTKEPVSPCGSCRQVMIESEERFQAPIKLILIGEDKIRVLLNVTQLLPLGFDKSFLLDY